MGFPAYHVARHILSLNLPFIACAQNQGSSSSKLPMREQPLVLQCLWRQSGSCLASLWCTCTLQTDTSRAPCLYKLMLQHESLSHIFMNELTILSSFLILVNAASLQQLHHLSFKKYKSYTISNFQVINYEINKKLNIQTHYSCCRRPSLCVSVCS